MALTRFRVRSPERDHETDVDRMQRLRQQLAALRNEMERERDGLRERYEKVTANAAFSLLALEEDSGRSGMSSRIGDMTDTMIHYARRIASLETQIGFVTELDRRIDAFSRETADEKATA